MMCAPRPWLGNRKLKTFHVLHTDVERRQATISRRMKRRVENPFEHNNLEHVRLRTCPRVVRCRGVKATERSLVEGNLTSGNVTYVRNVGGRDVCRLGLVKLRGVALAGEKSERHICGRHYSRLDL